MVFRWFVGLDLDQPPWDHSWFSKNRARRFTKSGLLERLYNETVALTMAQKSAAHRTNLNGARMQANALHTRVVPVKIVLNLEEYEPLARSLDQTRIRTIAIPRSRVETSCA